MTGKASTLPGGRAVFVVALLGAGTLTAQIAAAQVQPPTVTYRVAVESNAGMDGGIAWQSVFLLNDGRIASFGTGNHAPEQSNAMRIIDPVTNPSTVGSYDLFPWTQSGGVNRYVSNYDNHPSIYIPSENKAVWINHGVFDFAQSSWTYGDREPSTRTWRAFLDDPASSIVGAYNPAVAWCATLDKGVWFGNSSGGYGQDFDVLSIIERNTGGSTPWKVTSTDLGSQGVAGLWYSRNSAVCVGEYLYVGGPKAAGGGNAFYKIHVPTKRLTATLAPFPVLSGEYFPQMVYDSARGHIVLVGAQVLDYDPATDIWRNVTPSGWRGYRSPMGVYHPLQNAIYFRGTPLNVGAYSENFEWHKLVFGAPGTGVSPKAPGGLSVN